MTSRGITTLESLQDHLYSAMILEHATLPAYLTAMYSIKPGSNQDAYDIIRVVAVEEMLHLTFAANLLNAIDGVVDLTQKGFVPDYPTYIPDSIEDFKIHIEAFSKDAIETFLKIERPVYPGQKIKPVVKRRIPGHAWCVSPDDSGETQYATIGEFYTAIKEGFGTIEAEHQARGQTIFTGNPDHQITSEYYYSGGGKLFAVTDLTSAIKAIDLVIDQGEGYVQEGMPSGVFDPEGELAHFYRFHQILHRQYYQPGDDPGKPSGPPFPVDWEAIYLVKEDPKLKDYPEGSELHQAAVDFNLAYATFLKLLTRAYNGERELLTNEAMPGMFDFRNRMTQLIRNPIPGQNGVYAAPTFQIDAAWDVLGGADKD